MTTQRVELVLSSQRLTFRKKQGGRKKQAAADLQQINNSVRSEYGGFTLTPLDLT